jgi:pimeloyl-ACP methyl ester carboxylesterase
MDGLPLEEGTADAPSWLSWSLRRPGRSGHALVDGRRLHYLEWDGPGPSARTVLLVHGFRGHAHWWDGIAPHLAEDFRVLALDLSGMGDSDPRSVYPIEFAALDIIDLLDALRPGPVLGIGHSYGGSRMLRACADRPDLFERLIVCDSFVLLPGVAIPTDTASTSTAKRHYPDLQQAMSRYRLMPEQPGSEPAMLDHIARHSLHQEAAGWCWKFDPILPRGVANEEQGTSYLPRVQRPVDVVHGECSVIVDRELARQCVQLLPQGRGPLGMPGTHHHMMIDQPLAMIAMLRGLLATERQT